MIAKLKERNNYYYCSNCLMRQYNLEITCFFCGATFSNWEEIMVKVFREKEEMAP